MQDDSPNSRITARRESRTDSLGAVAGWVAMPAGAIALIAMLTLRFAFHGEQYWNRIVVCAGIFWAGFLISVLAGVVAAISRAGRRHGMIGLLLAASAVGLWAATLVAELVHAN